MDAATIGLIIAVSGLVITEFTKLARRVKRSSCFGGTVEMQEDTEKISSSTDEIQLPKII